MIKCENCQTEFMADHTQGYPGHVDPPGALIAYALLFAVISLLCFAASIFILRTFMIAAGSAFLAGTLFSLTSILNARRFCEHAGGGVCPACGHKNEVRWHS